MSQARCSDRIVLNDELVGAWVRERGGGFYREGTKCIGLQNSRGELVAGVLYDFFNGASVYMHTAIERITREFIRVCFDYPFNQLRCNVVIGLVPEGNTKARRFDEHLGFMLNTRIPGGDPTGDLLVYTMNRDQCRWLDE
jgi:hypothetical protein